MHERTKQPETDKLTEPVLNRSLRKSSSHQISVHQATSIGSSSRHLFALVPGFVDLPEPQTHTDDSTNDEKANVERVVKKRKSVSIFRIAGLNKPEWPYLLTGSLGSIGCGLMFPLFGLLLSTTISIFFLPPHELKKATEFWGLMMVFLGLGSLVTMLVQNYFFEIASRRLIRRIRSLTFKKVVHQEISWFDDPVNSSGVIGEVSQDVAQVRPKASIRRERGRGRGQPREEEQSDGLCLSWPKF